MAEPRVAAFVLAPVLAGCSELGVDVRSLQRRAGIPELERGGAERRIPYRKIADFWDLAIRATGDPALGLRVAKTVKLEDFDLILYLARSSATLRDALRDVDQYGALLADGIRFVLREHWRHPSIAVEFAGRPHPAGADYVIGVLFRSLRDSSHGLATPVEIRFDREEPSDMLPYRRTFGVPVRFEAESNAVVLRCEEGLSRVVSPRADPGLHDLLARLAGRTLETGDSDALEHQLRDAIRAELPQGRPDTAKLAMRLGIAERSLRRRLAARGSSVGQVVDAVRLELAKRYLADPHRSVAETAHALGFSEASAFHRAFRRWTGRTPRAFARERTG